MDDLKLHVYTMSNFDPFNVSLRALVLIENLPARFSEYKTANKVSFLY
jgi:hypothetical protein